MNRLNFLLQRDKNSLDFIRFVAAVAVIFTHAYPYALGADHQYDDALAQFTHGQFTFGQLAVVIFFMLSGFLVTASLDRSQNAVSYMKARLLRIYPGLMALVLLTIFVLGPLVTNLSLSDYFHRGQTFKYFKVLLLYNPIHYSLPGVFTGNVYPSLLNGSLWTLFWEVLCYGLVLALWSLKLLKKKVVLILWMVFLILRLLMQEVLYYNVTNPFIQSLRPVLFLSDISMIIPLTLPFLTGMVFYLYRDQITLKRSYLIIGMPLFVICAVLGQGLPEFWIPTFGAYSLFYLASLGMFKNFARYGDFSYGLYIYAPLVQQSVTYTFGGMMEPILNFVLATPITLICAILSWHLVEKPALTLKNRTLGWNRKLVSGVTKV